MESSVARPPPPFQPMEKGKRLQMQKLKRKRLGFFSASSWRLASRQGYQYNTLVLIDSGGWLLQHRS